MKTEIRSFEDLDVYQRLVQLHLDVKCEMYELGSQLRRSSNSVPANLAEGGNNNHVSMYLEGINRAFVELRETKHHLCVAFRKGYLKKKDYDDLVSRYEEAGRMLRRLEKSLQRFKP